MRVLAAIAPVAQRHLQRHLDRGRAAVGEEHVRQAGRRDRQKRARNRFGGLVREAGENHLIELVGLRLDRGDDLRVAVAVRDDPPRRDGIEDAPAVRRRQPCALGARDLQHVAFERVLREGMPKRRRTRWSWPAHPKPEDVAQWKLAAKAARSVAGSSGSRRGRRPEHLARRRNARWSRRILCRLVPVKAMPSMGMARRFSASIDSRLWLMVPSRVRGARASPAVSSARRDRSAGRCASAAPVSPPAPSMTSGPAHLRAGRAPRCRSRRRRSRRR